LALKPSGGGLGTEVSLTLGTKLAAQGQLAVSALGDGAYSYNPVTASFGAAQEHDLPILVLLFNNGSYRSMRTNLEQSYPDGTAVTNQDYTDSEIAPTPAYAEQA
jgi:acetolactate synthase-1/2/3 large subunit